MRTEKKPNAKKTAKKKKVILKPLYPIRNTSDFPATQGMLLETQKMFSTSIKSVKKTIESMDKRFDSMDKRFDSIDLKLQSFIEEVRADRHQIKIMLETQGQKTDLLLRAMNSFITDRTDQNQK